MRNRSLDTRIFARQHRSNPTRSESAIWALINAGQLGAWFRRQVPLANGRYIADFLAPAKRVIVEVDGGWHNGRKRADERRDRVLRRLGYRVVRLDAELVSANVGEAVALIRTALEAS